MKIDYFMTIKRYKFFKINNLIQISIIKNEVNKSTLHLFFNNIVFNYMLLVKLK